jgi:hypothetical protein
MVCQTCLLNKAGVKPGVGSSPSHSAIFRLTMRLKTVTIQTMKKLITSILLAASVVSLVAGTVNLAWDASPSPEVNRYTVYALKGTNAVFAVGNTNATTSVTVTNQLTATFTNLSVGTWNFVATAKSTNNLESVNSNQVQTNVVPGAPTVLRLTP